MKRFLMAMLVLCALCTGAMAEQTEGAALAPILAAYPDADLLSCDQWTPTAAAVLSRGDERILCISEQQNGAWNLTVATSSALPADTDIRLFLDTDNALFWSYEDDWYHYSFSSFKGKDGAWQAPVCIRRDWMDAKRTMYTEVEHVYREGLLSFRVSRWDENENLQSESTVGPFPAKWMAAHDTLATFQIDTAATAAHVSEDSWMNEAALRLTAAEMEPKFTFVAGSATEKGLEILMRDEEGRLRMITWQWNGGNSITNISSPLPEGTVYGYENFSHCLWLPQGIVVSLDAFRNGVWYPEYAFEEKAAGEPLFFGRNWIREGAGTAGHYYIGDHPWTDVSIMDWNGLPGTLSDGMKKLDASHWAVVNNPNPEDRLHLRDREEKGAVSFGKFYNGTPVYVLRKYNGWAFVRIPGGSSGWMMDTYLAFGTNGWAVENAFPRLHFTEDKERFTVLNAGHVLHGDPSEAWTVEKGDTYCIIGVYGDEWYYVWFPELDAGGMMLQSDFWPGNG